MANAYNPKEVSQLHSLFRHCETLHERYVFDAIISGSESEALKEVRLNQEAALIRNLKAALIALGEYQAGLIDAASERDARITAQVNDLLN